MSASGTPALVSKGSQPRPLRLLVAIPCLNEAETIAAVIKRVPRAIDGVSAIDVLVVDDGSSDATASEARSAGAVLLAHGVNRGVGVAFQSAISYAIEGGYDMMLNMDGDGQFQPEDIPKLVAPIVSGQADMVTASRFLDKSLVPNMPPVKLAGNRMMSWLISGLVRKRFADVSCGFRCYSREALLRINLHGRFTYTQETFLDFAVKNMRICELPVKVLYFEGRKSRVAGSIVKYAFNSASIIFRSYRDYFPLRFFWTLALACAFPGVTFAAVFFGHFLITGAFTGFLFAGFLAAFFIAMTLTFGLVGVVTDMLDRIRANQERILYLLRKQGSSRSANDQR